MKWFKNFLVSRANSGHTKSTNHTQGTKEISKFPSLDLAFDVIGKLINAQLQDTALDSKATFAFGTATGVISAALVLQSLLLPTHAHSSCSVFIPGFLHTLPLWLRRAMPFLPLLGAYLGVVITASFGYKGRDYKQVPSPRHFLYNLQMPEQESKAMMVRAMVEAYEWNKNQANKKMRWINWAFVALVIETLALVLLVLYQVAC